MSEPTDTTKASFGDKVKNYWSELRHTTGNFTTQVKSVAKNLVRYSGESATTVLSPSLTVNFHNPEKGKDETKSDQQASKSTMKKYVNDTNAYLASGVTIKIAQPKAGQFASEKDLEIENYDPTFLLDQFTVPKKGRATLRMRMKDKTNKFKDKFYSKFFLESVAFSSNERVQMTETFDSYVVSFRGTEPTTLQIKGTLLNAVNEDWLIEFMRFYEAYKATSMSLRDDVQDRLVTVVFENFQFSGYLFGFSTAIEASTEYGVPFQLTMLVAKTDIGAKAETFEAWTTSYVTITDTIWKEMQRMDQCYETTFIKETEATSIPNVQPNVQADPTNTFGGTG